MNSETTTKPANPSLCERIALGGLAEIREALKQHETIKLQSTAAINALRPILEAAEARAEIATAAAKGFTDAAELKPLEVDDAVTVPVGTPLADVLYHGRTGTVDCIAPNGQWGNIGVKMDTREGDEPHWETNTFIFAEGALIRTPGGDDGEEGGAGLQFGNGIRRDDDQTGRRCPSWELAILLLVATAFGLVLCWAHPDIDLSLSPPPQVPSPSFEQPYKLA